MNTKFFALCLIGITNPYLIAGIKPVSQSSWNKPNLDEQTYEIIEDDQYESHDEPNPRQNHLAANNFANAVHNAQLAYDDAFEKNHSWDTIVNRRLRLVLEQKRNKSILNRPINGMSPLCHAVQCPAFYNYVQELLTAGADANCPSCDDGYLPIQLAVTEKARQELLKYGAFNPE